MKRKETRNCDFSTTKWLCWLDKKNRSFLQSTIVTLAIVAMLIFSGPAEAVRVSINANDLNNRSVGDTGSFYVNVTIGINERIPITNITVEGLPDINGSPGGILTFNVSDFSEVDDFEIKGNYNISLIEQSGLVSGFGYGYGYDNNTNTPPFVGYGYAHQFFGYGYGYGSGYGYGTGYGYGSNAYTNLVYKITVNTVGAAPGDYDVVVKVNAGTDVTDQEVSFQGSFEFNLAPENLIKNPGFESGTTPWIFFTNGIGTFSMISPGNSGNNAAKIVLSNVSTNTQLYQKGITLQANTRYRLSFAAYSSTGHDMRVRLLQHDVPFTSYAPDFIPDLGTSWQTFTTEFDTKGFSGTVDDARLMFYFIGFAEAEDTYFIDDVRLEKVGPINAIDNPGFESGTTPWIFFTNGIGTFSMISPGNSGNNAAKIVLSNVSTNTQLYQKGITLQANTRYRLSFAAYSSTGHDMRVRLFQHDVPFTSYAPDFIPDLGTSWQTFTTEFDTKGFSGTVDDARLMFYFAGFAEAGDTYFIDDVRLEKMN